MSGQECGALKVSASPFPQQLPATALVHSIIGISWIIKFLAKKQETQERATKLNPNTSCFSLKAYHESKAVLEVDVTDAPESTEESFHVFFPHLVGQPPYVHPTRTHGSQRLQENFVRMRDDVISTVLAR